MHTIPTRLASILAVTLVIVSGAGATGSRVVFSTPEEAAGTLLAAIESGNYPLFLSVAGPQMAGFWGTGDPERDALDRYSFVSEARRTGIRPDSSSGNQQVFYVGSVLQPFPAPLVPTDGGWGFDDEAGFGKLAARQIHRNEIAAIELCQRFREAEFTYLGMAVGGEPGFALKIRSTPGQHDGLFWSGDGEEDESPLGPPFAAAAFAERQPGDGTRPLFGYYFKILTAQGPNVAGGPLDYRSNGRLRKGFALIAWPAEYGVNGTRSFQVNHFGDVYQKDLGTDTARIASSIKVFNPDRSWSRLHGTD